MPRSAVDAEHVFRVQRVQHSLFFQGIRSVDYTFRVIILPTLIKINGDGAKDRGCHCLIKKRACLADLKEIFPSVMARH